MLCFLLLPLVCQAQGPLLGADKVLAAMKPKAVEEKKRDPIEDASIALRDRLPNLGKQEAAKAFVALFQKWDEATPPPSSPFSRANSWQVMTALPPPDAWPIIRDDLSKLRGKRARSATALFDDLLGHDDEVLKYLENQ